MRLTSKLAKSAIMIPKILWAENLIWVSKNAEFDADIESAEKVAKNSCEKSY